MAAAKPEDVIRELKGGKYAPLYFLQGEEPYYLDAISDFIEKNALVEAEKGFNQTILYGKDVQVSDVLTHARRFPMMAQKQVVIVKEAQSIADLNKEDGEKLLLHYARQPVPSTILVFCHKHKTLDGRKQLGKELGKLAVMVTSKPIQEYQVSPWIDQYVKGRGMAITQKANMLLTEYIGNNLERLSNEIEKILINFKGEKVNIDEDLVHKFVGINKDYNGFELQKALIFKNVDKTSRMVNYFEANPKNNPPVMLIALLYTLYAKLLIASTSRDKSAKGLASLLKVSPYFVADYQKGIQNYSFPQLCRAIGYLREADLRVKGVDAGSITQGNILRELVFKLMH
ncbi:MAG: DNA polymerase III subunit delta [Cyclobacteriaceae bacterium]|nr:DNA polymerase III subunit delta [Cyclobacteriaceae bacterium]